MPQTYHQLKQHIADLEAQAAQLRRSEAAGVIAQARRAITVYGLTRNDLFGGTTVGTPIRRRGAKAAKAGSAAPKYTDGKGGFWVGRGKRPRWLSDLLKAGARLEQFLIDKVSTGAVAAQSGATAAVAGTTSRSAAPKKREARKTARAAVAKGAKPAKKAANGARVKYRDDAGHSWSGFGPRPKWLKEAIAAGWKLEDLRA